MELRKIIFGFFFIMIFPGQHDFYGQFFQDEIVANIFKFKRNGFFVDIGAHDGISHSNSYFFEKNLDWNGICIEAMPHVFSILKKNRKCICLNECLMGHVGIVEFCLIRDKYNNVDGLSGILDFFNDSLKKTIDILVQKHNLIKEIIPIKTNTLSNILDHYNITDIDYLSIDIEGAEFDVLKSLDFKKYNITIVDVENNFANEDIRQFLSSVGYLFYKRIGVDDFFIKK